MSDELEQRMTELRELTSKEERRLAELRQRQEAATQQRATENAADFARLNLAARSFVEKAMSAGLQIESYSIERIEERQGLFRTRTVTVTERIRGWTIEGGASSSYGSQPTDGRGVTTEGVVISTPEGSWTSSRPLSASDATAGAVDRLINLMAQRLVRGND